MFSRLREMLRQRRGRKDLYSTQAYWDSKAVAFNNTAVSMWPNQSLNRHYEKEQIEIVKKFADPISGKSVLDLGCGTGRFSRWFAQHGAEVMGIDFSRGSLDIAEKLSAPGNPSYRHGSVFDLNEEAAYDIVFIWGVLTVACRDKNELKDALIRIHRSLRPGGFVLLLEPVHRGFLHRVLDLDLHEFIAIMKKAGFDIKEAKPMHFWPIRLALAYIPWPAWITLPFYHLGQALMKLPGLASLGDYWAIVTSPIPAQPPTDE